MDLPTVVPPPLPTTGREMQVTDSILRGGRIIFTTLIPNTDPCGFGGTGWLMELSAGSGSRLAFTPFDVNGDGIFSSDDFVQATVDVDGDGDVDGDDKVSASGKKCSGICSTPTIVTGKGREYKQINQSTSAVETTTESSPDGTPRQSWRQLQ